MTGIKMYLVRLTSKLIMRVRETYPFHPLYVDTLLDILDKHEGLQKTRDLLRISRKVVRAVVGDKQNVYDLIMPWHIDVEMDDIRNLLLAPNYESV
jgi:Predicted ATPase (AAA+ superfamily)